jgi:hypothetical protein
MCSACAGDYENPDLTAPAAEDAEAFPARGDIVAASERLRAAIEQLARIEQLELQLLREAVRVTREAGAALEVACPTDTRAGAPHKASD